MATDAFYIRIIADPWAKHPKRKFSKNNMYSLCNLVFRVKYPEPRMEETVSTLDGTCATQKCYIIERDEFLRVCPQFEEDQGIMASKTVAIPVEFATPWLPEGRFDRNGKLIGMEGGVYASKRWVEEAKKKGRSTNPFLLKNSKWV